MEVEVGSLTQTLDKILELFRLGRADVIADASSLIALLVTIEIVLLSLFWALTGEDVLVGLIKKILAIGFFVFLVQNYDSFIGTVIEGFIYTGKRAATSSAATVQLRDPSGIINVGMNQVVPIMEHIRSYSGFTDQISNLSDIIISALCALGVMFAYFIIAAQAFITYIEFGLVSTVGVILLPFGVFKHTAFLSEKLFGAIISFGVKLMTLSLIVSITLPLVQQFILPPDPNWDKLFQLLFVTLAIGLLSWHAPSVASGLMSGSPTLTAGTAAGLAASAGVVGAGVGLAASRAPGAVSAATRNLFSGGQAALGAGAAVSGTFVGGAAGAAAGSTRGAASAGASALTSGVRAVASSAYSRVSAPIQGAATRISNQYSSAREMARQEAVTRTSRQAIDVNQGGTTVRNEKVTPIRTETTEASKASKPTELRRDAGNE